MKEYLRELRGWAGLIGWFAVMLPLFCMAAMGSICVFVSLFDKPVGWVWWQFLLIAVFGFWGMFTFNFICEGRGKS